MLKILWRLLVNQLGQMPEGNDGGDGSGDVAASDVQERTTESVAQDDINGLRMPYESTNDAQVQADSRTQTQQPQQQQQDPSFLEGLNLDPSTFSPENKEIFRRMQGGYTKALQKARGFEEKA